MSKINVGDIWLANLNPNKGREPGKTRPVVILQNQALLDIKHPTTLIAPLTSQLMDHLSPLRVRIYAKGKLQKTSDILIDQIRAIDNKRLTEGPLTQLSASELKVVYGAVCEIMGMEMWQDTSELI